MQARQAQFSMLSQLAKFRSIALRLLYIFFLYSVHNIITNKYYPLRYRFTRAKYALMLFQGSLHFDSA